MSSKIANATLLDINTATPSSVRAVNRSILLGLIRRRQPISRADLARLTGIFRSSVSDIVDELIAEQLVTEERSTPSQRGRVPISLRLNDAAYRVVGLNIRPAYCQVAVAGLSGVIQQNLTFETPASPTQLVRALSKAINGLQKKTPRNSSRVFQKIGVSVPGHVDVYSGQIVWTPTHPELNGYPLTGEISKTTGIDTVADNDCNAGALSEVWLGSGERNQTQTDFTFLNVSDFGTGAGVVLNGEVYRGHDFRFAAEVGHMIVESSGPLCRCGRRGCWELYVSNDATWRRVHPRLPFTLEGFGQMLDAAKAGDTRARAAFAETARYLAIGISNIGFAFNPAEIIVAGRITAIWDLVRDHLTGDHNSSHLRYSVRPAHLSADDSLLHGAVCLALHNTFARPKFGEVSTRHRRAAHSSIQEEVHV
jgi:predicted NBD/HSP70 family sugar kinase